MEYLLVLFAVAGWLACAFPSYLLARSWHRRECPSQPWRQSDRRIVLACTLIGGPYVLCFAVFVWLFWREGNDAPASW